MTFLGKPLGFSRALWRSHQINGLRRSTGALLISDNANKPRQCHQPPAWRVGSDVAFGRGLDTSEADMQTFAAKEILQNVQFRQFGAFVSATLRILIITIRQCHHSDFPWSSSRQSIASVSPFLLCLLSKPASCFLLAAVACL